MCHHVIYWTLIWLLLLPRLLPFSFSLVWIAWSSTLWVLICHDVLLLRWSSTCKAVRHYGNCSVLSWVHIRKHIFRLIHLMPLFWGDIDWCTDMILVSPWLVWLTLSSLVFKRSTIGYLRLDTVQGSWLAAVTVPVLLSFARPVLRVDLDRAHRCVGYFVSLLFRHDMCLMSFESLHSVVMIAILVAVFVALPRVNLTATVFDIGLIPRFVRQSSSTSIILIFHALVTLFGVHITHIDWLFIRKHDPAEVIWLYCRGEAAWDCLVTFLAPLSTFFRLFPLTLLLSVLIF